MGASLRTAQLSLAYGQRYTIATPDSPEREGTFDILTCESSEPRDLAAFLSIVDAFSSGGGDGQGIADFFRGLARLFAVLPAPDLASERQGLWGELFMMRTVKGFAFWLPFWHGDPLRKFDFSTPGRRVEAKAAQSDERIHHFSHRQLFPVDDEEIVIASLLVRADDSGLSLGSLLAEARALAGAAHAEMKLEQAVRRAGMNDPTEDGPRFDEHEAVGLIQWFRAEDVPRFTSPEPAGVWGTRYSADLSTATPMSDEEIRVWLAGWLAEASVSVERSA